MKEIWKPINGFETLYLVSNTGKIFSNYRKREIKSFISRIGYHDVYLKNQNKTTIRKLHRLVAEHFVENQLNYPQINHLDGNKSNNNANNLEWITISNNIKHAFKTGLKIPKRGVDNNKSKLSEKEVNEIRKLRLDGWKLIKLALTFNVSASNISDIVNYKTWKHI